MTEGQKRERQKALDRMKALLDKAEQRGNGNLSRTERHEYNELEATVEAIDQDARDEAAADADPNHPRRM